MLADFRGLHHVSIGVAELASYGLEVGNLCECCGWRPEADFQPKTVPWGKVQVEKVNKTHQMDIRHLYSNSPNS